MSSTPGHGALDGSAALLRTTIASSTLGTDVDGWERYIDHGALISGAAALVTHGGSDVAADAIERTLRNPRAR